MRIFVQLSVDVTADMREMSGKAISKTEFPSDPIEFTCKDPSLGVAHIFIVCVSQIAPLTEFSSSFKATVGLKTERP